MSVPYPKAPKDIPIRVIHCDIEDGLMSSIKTTAEISLAEKLNDYLYRLGYSSAHIMGILVRLMTKSKVRVDFRNHTERLELLDPTDSLTAPQAISLLEDFIAQNQQPVEGTVDSKHTQRIIVQPPLKPPGKTQPLK
jgi:hypothetical protein